MPWPASRRNEAWRQRRDRRRWSSAWRGLLTGSRRRSRRFRRMSHLPAGAEVRRADRPRTLRACARRRSPERARSPEASIDGGRGCEADGASRDRRLVRRRESARPRWRWRRRRSDLDASCVGPRARRSAGTRDQLRQCRMNECGGCRGHSGHGGSIARSFADTSAAYARLTAHDLVAWRSDRRRSRHRGGNAERESASKLMRALFAAPSTGAAASLMSQRAVPFAGHNGSPGPRRHADLERKLDGVAVRGITPQGRWTAGGSGRILRAPGRG